MSERWRVMNGILGFFSIARAERTATLGDL